MHKELQTCGKIALTKISQLLFLLCLKKYPTSLQLLKHFFTSYLFIHVCNFFLQLQIPLSQGSDVLLQWYLHTWHHYMPVEACTITHLPPACDQNENWPVKHQIRKTTNWKTKRYIETLPCPINIILNSLNMPCHWFYLYQKRWRNGTFSQEIFPHLMFWWWWWWSVPSNTMVHNLL